MVRITNRNFKFLMKIDCLRCTVWGVADAGVETAPSHMRLLGDPCRVLHCAGDLQCGSATSAV